ncbi:MAG: GldG family protein [Chloroflexota bacterium]
MKPEWKKYAPIGLYVAVGAIIASAVLYFIEREFNLNLQISLGLIVIGIAAFVMLDPGSTREFFGGRQARYGSNALVLMLAFTGILIVINYLVYKNPQDWDITEDKTNTLSEDTINVLDKLEDPVQAVGFFSVDSSSSEDNARDTLDRFITASGGKISYEFFDPNSDIGKAQEYGISQDGSLVLSIGDKQETLTYVDEREITAAMIRLLSGEERVVYFVTGHGEIDINDFGEESYSIAKSALEGKNYRIEILNLLTEKAIPENADLLVIPRPLFVFSDEEVDLLSAYLASGGALVVLKNPYIQNVMDNPADTSDEIPVDPLDDYLLENWGIVLGSDIIVDVDSQTGLEVIADSYSPFHPITQKLANVASIYPLARSIAINQGVPNVNGEILVYSSENTWAENDLNSLLEGAVEPNDGIDMMGPIGLAASAENSETSGRVVVFGDAEFLIDANYNVYANGSMFVNAIDWAAEQEDLIDLTQRDNTERFMAPLTNSNRNLVIFMSVFFVPGALVIAGISVYLTRRKRT